MNPSPNRDEASTAKGPGDHARVATTTSAPPREPGPTHAAVESPPPVEAHRSGLRRAVWGGIILAAVGAACWYGIPMVQLALNTVSTDDAYVNGHPTFVAARVPGQVIGVYTDDNKPVKKGQLIVQLDPVPYKVQVKLKKAILATAQADEVVADAQVRGVIAQARANRFKLEHTIDVVNNQIAELRGTVAALDSDLAKRDRALKDFERVKELMKTPGATTQQDLDLKLQDYLVAKAKVRQAVEGVLQLRAGLGLTTKPVNADELKEAPKSLAETPGDLDQTFPAVRQAAAEMLQSVAALGVYPSSFDLRPKQILEEFLKRDPEGNIDRIFANIIKEAPSLKQARAKVVQADADLAQAQLNLDYCDVYAEIDGVVSRRNVNEGNNVQAGQSLMTIRSLTKLWIDANFKETQLAELRIGQPVKIEVDMYGSRQEFDGRITGFSMGTGQTLALLPPQNATGNFVKIVQRLPVRIELMNYNPEKPNQKPLFLGLSVTPYVYIHKPLVGDDPGKGRLLQSYQPEAGRE